MSLETDLKKTMGYTEDTSVRCYNCTHCAVKDTISEDNAGYVCTANLAQNFDVDTNGRCDHFSAKRPRKSKKTPDAVMAS